MLERSPAPPEVLRSVTVPIAALVAVAVAAAWLVTWATSDVMMALLGVPTFPPTPLDLALFFALLVVMMVAMMLPSAVPMVLTFRGLTRLEAGRPVRPADDVATALFVVPYFLVWGGFAVAAILGLVAAGLLVPMAGLPGALGFLPAVALVAAGAWQLTRTKEVCLDHCRSPMGFVMDHWRSGRAGAFRMGLRHAAFCIGCCWLFMIVLFVAGAASLLWMAGLSVAIFLEKVGVRPSVVPRAIGATLVGLGLLLGARAAFGL